MMTYERIRESDLVVPALRLMSERADGFISTSDLIAEISEIFNPIGRDAQIIDGRSDTYFSQKVRNLICHRHGVNSFIVQELANYDEDREGLEITQAGRGLLDNLADD